jgi:hypothetical protein
VRFERSLLVERPFASSASSAAIEHDPDDATTRRRNRLLFAPKRVNAVADAAADASKILFIERKVLAIEPFLSAEQDAIVVKRSDSYAALPVKRIEPDLLVKLVQAR